MTTRFSIDIDGTVADMHGAIAKLSHQLHIANTQPKHLDPDIADVVMQERRKQIEAEMDGWIEAHLEEFWGSLDLLASDDDRRAIRQAIAIGYELFFVSERPSRTPARLYEITLDWLKRQDFPVDASHVILTRDKPSVMRDKNIRYHLDDMVPHAARIMANSETQVFLVQRPWNRHVFQPDTEGDYQSRAAAFGMEEVASIAEYLTIITQRRSHGRD
jgi:uncharacterized HAD superfamily protein